MILDGLIVAAPKDYNKIPYAAAAMRAHVEGLDTIHVITPTVYDQRGLVCHRDSQVLDFDRNKFRYRPNWIYQQFLKLFQNVTSNDWYMVIDADLIFNRDVQPFVGDQPVLFLARDQNNPPYFRFNEVVLGYGKVYPWSFLSECTLYNKSVIGAMLSFAGERADRVDIYNRPGGALSFMQDCASIIDSNCFPAESELYGSFVCRQYPDLYRFHHLKSAFSGKYEARTWADFEIQDHIERMKSMDVDIFAIHSWEGKP